MKKIEIEFKENPSLKDAVEANIAWFNAENNNLGSFNDRMDLCKYSEWASRKAIGQDIGEFQCVPRLILTLE